MRVARLVQERLSCEGDVLASTNWRARAAWPSATAWSGASRSVRTPLTSSHPAVLCPRALFSDSSLDGTEAGCSDPPPPDVQPGHRDLSATSWSPSKRPSLGSD